VGLSGGSHEGLPTNPFTKPFSVAIVVICPKGPSPKNVTCHMHVNLGVLSRGINKDRLPYSSKRFQVWLC
jgi:hypothetical protein